MKDFHHSWSVEAETVKKKAKMVKSTKLLDPNNNIIEFAYLTRLWSWARAILQLGTAIMH